MTVEVDGGDTTLSPDDAFTLLGNETRIGILRALWEAHEPYAEDNTVPFSVLYDRVGAEDSGNFNYHLGKLTDHFVRRTDDGYELTAPGFEVVRAVVAGGATENPVLEPTVVDATCVRCGRPIEIAYEDGTTWARCTGCEGYWRGEGGIFGFSLPPEGLRNRGPDGIFDATIVYSIHRFETMHNGVCPECGATVDASLDVCEDHDASDGICGTCGFYFQGIMTFVCDSCKFAWRSPSYAAAYRCPALISFYYDHGIGHVHSSWEAIRRGLEWHETLLSADPIRLRLTVILDEDELHLTLNDTGIVIGIDR